MAHTFVQPKKHLGQHFLKDDNIARKIVDSLHEGAADILEIGPGMGVLTKFLLELKGRNCYFIDTDKESIAYLHDRFPDHRTKFIHGDFLTFEPEQIFPGKYDVIGNLPYNISSQILFKVLEQRHKVTHLVIMIQKEVAERLASGPGTKKYGILSVLLQAYYRIEYLFTVNETVFIPPPNVKSAVIRLVRNETARLACDERLFFQVVKTAFNQRRKTLRNSLKGYSIDYEGGDVAHLAGKRAEQLGVEDFVRLTQLAGGERYEL